MIFRRLGLINKNQRGFTVLELLIAIALSGIIAGATTTAIFQVINGSARTSNHMTAVRQVQKAGYLFSSDVQMAQSVELTADPDGFPLTLSWTDWETGDEYEVVYTLLADNKLQREHYTNRDTNPNPDATTIVAQFIDPANCELTAGGFSLPDVDDAFTISDPTGGDSGTITITAGSISANTTGTATYDGATGAWTTPAAGDTVVVAATSTNTTGDWTATTGTATAAITADVNGNAILANGVLILTVTATVGEASETREYRIIPRPSSW